MHDGYGPHVQGIEAEEAQLKASIEDRDVELERLKDFAEHGIGMAKVLQDCVSQAPECIKRPLKPGLEKVTALSTLAGSALTLA